MLMRMMEMIMITTILCLHFSQIFRKNTDLLKFHNIGRSYIVGKTTLAMQAALIGTGSCPSCSTSDPEPC